MANTFKFMVSADWHLGTTDPKKFHQELLKLVESRIKDIHYFIIAGDIFDTKEQLSSEVVKEFFLILRDLEDMSDCANFRIINGTRTHDAKQLETLEVICKEFADEDNIDFIINEPYFEDGETKILYLPEEYMTREEYLSQYAKYFSEDKIDYYDFIFGHGPTDLMWYLKVDDEGLSKEYSSAMVHKVEDILTFCRYAFFGHFHYNIETGQDKRFVSIGPVSRWEFDKTGRCGLYYCEYDRNTRNLITKEYLVNHNAPVLPTVEISILKEYDLDTLHKVISDKLRECQGADKVRLSITMDSSLENYIVMKDFILSSFGNLSKIKLQFKAVDMSSESIEDVKVVEENMEDKPYLYDKSMRDEDRINAFIRRKDGSNIPVDNILEVITARNNKITSQE